MRDIKQAPGAHSIQQLEMAVHYIATPPEITQPITIPLYVVVAW